MAVRQLDGAGGCAPLRAFRAAEPEADQGPDVLAERLGLFPLEVARRERRDRARRILAHDEQVDQPYDRALLQLLEDGKDLAFEAVALERDAQKLDGSE